MQGASTMEAYFHKSNIIHKVIQILRFTTILYRITLLYRYSLRSLEILLAKWVCIDFRASVERSPFWFILEKSHSFNVLLESQARYSKWLVSP